MRVINNTYNSNYYTVIILYLTGIDYDMNLWYNVSMVDIYYEDAFTTLYLGDCKDVMKALPADFIDLVLTDPPYTKETYYYAYKALADEAPRLMTYGASLVTLVGQYLLPEVTALFWNRLRMNWIIWMEQPRAHAIMRGFGIEVTGMPNLWYVKGKGIARTLMMDSFTLTGTDGITKPLHPWQKDESWADYFIQHLTLPGNVILDPFCGSGTTLASAKRLGRIGIGAEINEKNCKQIVGRLNG